MTILVSGSYAYDNITMFHDKFKNHIMPDKVHMLNVCFLVPDMRKEFGGCAGNISYNLKLLNEDVTPMATVGTDFQEYQNWLAKCQINSKAIKIIDESFTGQAFITTDEDNNQITTFHPGAMDKSHYNHVNDIENIDVGIVSPAGKEGMMQHCEEFYQNKIKFIFDPGQGLPMFSGDELKDLINKSTWLAVNDYESELIQQKTGLKIENLTDFIEAVFVTKGKDGSIIYTKNEEIKINSCQISDDLDPTGCGDAYRAGLLYGIKNNLDLRTTVQISSLMGAIKIEHKGTQNHTFNKQEFQQRYFDNFACKLNL